MKISIYDLFILLILCVCTINSISVDNSTNDELISPAVFRADENPDNVSDRPNNFESNIEDIYDDQEYSEHKHSEEEEEWGAAEKANSDGVVAN